MLLPWFVVIGEPGGGKSALIKESGPQSFVVTAGQNDPPATSTVVFRQAWSSLIPLAVMLFRQKIVLALVSGRNC